MTENQSEMGRIAQEASDRLNQDDPFCEANRDLVRGLNEAHPHFAWLLTYGSFGQRVRVEMTPRMVVE